MFFCRKMDNTRDNLSIAVSAGKNKKLKYVKQVYGQIVIGPPGSGKSTYCQKMYNLLEQLNRKVTIVNLDPANENVPYEASIDVMKLITVQDVMEKFSLGPNGALMYCIETLEENFEWLASQLKDSKNNYFIFDCPGQVELYTHHASARNIFTKLQEFGFHLCVAHLVDSHYCSDPHKYISALLLSLSTMLQIGLPHINILSKADQLKQFQGKLLFNLDFYTDVLDLKYLLEALDEKERSHKYKKLNHAIVSMIEDFSLVTFQPVDANKNESLVRVLQLIDKSNGYAFSATEEATINTLLATAMGVQSESKRTEQDIDPYL